MEKLTFIFNANCGTLERQEKSFFCEPFFSTRLKQGDILIWDEDFFILNEVAFPCEGKKRELVEWLANEIKGFKKEDEITDDSRQSAQQIIEYISRYK